MRQLACVATKNTSTHCNQQQDLYSEDDILKNLSSLTEDRKNLELDRGPFVRFTALPYQNTCHAVHDVTLLLYKIRGPDARAGHCDNLRAKREEHPQHCQRMLKLVNPTGKWTHKTGPPSSILERGEGEHRCAIIFFIMSHPSCGALARCPAQPDDIIERPQTRDTNLQRLQD